MFALLLVWVRTAYAVHDDLNLSKILFLEKWQLSEFEDIFFCCWPILIKRDQMSDLIPSLLGGISDFGATSSVSVSNTYEGRVRLHYFVEK